MKTLLKIFAVLIILAVALAIGVRCLWSIRLTKEQERETNKTVRREFRQAPLDEAAPQLRKLYGERFFTVRFGEAFPYISLGMEPRVPYDFIGQQAENMIIRFAGNGNEAQTDVPRLKELIAYTETLLPLCTKEGAASLTERRLDGFFLVGDYDSAISLLESGKITSRTPAWCKGTAAKLRAHKAMDAKDNREAIRQLQAFIDFMLSDEQKDFEDCDPTSGIFYSREWVVARNYMRCFNMATEMKDAAKAAEYKELAKKNFSIALKKAKDDQKSLPVLKEEAKSVGL